MEIKNFFRLIEGCDRIQVMLEWLNAFERQKKPRMTPTCSEISDRVQKVSMFRWPGKRHSFDALNIFIIFVLENVILPVDSHSLFSFCKIFEYNKSYKKIILSLVLASL